jgi:hypothetical protein
MSGLAACAVHPGVPAIATCPRCGSYACPECAVALAGDELLCAPCVAAGHGHHPIAWEQPRSASLIVRYGRTLRTLFLEPRRFFARMPPAPVGRALLFGALHSVGPWLPIAVCGGLGIGLVLPMLAPTGADPPAPTDGLGGAPALLLAFFALAPLLILGQLLFACFVGAAVFHASARALGAREGAFGMPVRALAYGHVFSLLAVLGVACSGFQVLQLLLQAGYTTYALYLLAVGRYRLPRERAIAAALAPAFVLGALLVGIFVVALLTPVLTARLNPR